MDALKKQHKLICLAIAGGGFFVCTALILFGLRLPAAIAMVVIITADIYYYVRTAKHPWNTKNTFSLIIILLIGIVPLGLLTAQERPRPFFSADVGHGLHRRLFLRQHALGRYFFIQAHPEAHGSRA